MEPPAPTMLLLSTARRLSQSLRLHPAAAAARPRPLITTVERARRETAPRRLRRSLARTWVYTMGKGRRKPLLTSQQSRLLGNSSFVLVTLSFLSTDMM